MYPVHKNHYGTIQLYKGPKPEPKMSVKVQREKFNTESSSRKVNLKSLNYGDKRSTRRIIPQTIQRIKSVNEQLVQNPKFKNHGAVIR